MLRDIANQVAANAEQQGALLWRADQGYMLHIPEPPEGETLPVPLYILGLCFVRLTTDLHFKSQMLDWADRNQN